MPKDLADESMADDKITELTSTIRAKDQEIARLREEMDQNKVLYQMDVSALNSDVQYLRGRLGIYEYPFPSNSDKLPQQVHHEGMEVESPNSKLASFNPDSTFLTYSALANSVTQQSHQGTYKYQPTAEAPFQPEEELDVLLTATMASVEFFDPEAPHGFHNWQPGVEAFIPAEQNPYTEPEAGFAPNEHQRVHSPQPDSATPFQREPGPQAQLGASMAANTSFNQQIRQGVYHPQPDLEAASQPGQGPHAELGVEVPTCPYRVVKYIQPHGLSSDGIDRYIASTVGCDYNPLWLQRIGVEDQVLKTFHSKQKIVDYFTKVFAIGDEFRVKFTSRGRQTEGYATVSNFYKR